MRLRIYFFKKSKIILLKKDTKMKKITLLTLSTLITLLLSGCSSLGGSSSTGNTTSSTDTKTITALDGYIKDGTLTDNNGQVATYTVDGKYTFATSPVYPLNFTGGKYVDTNASFDINMTSQSGLVISPITSFLTNNVDSVTNLAVAFSLADDISSFEVDYIDANSIDLAKLSQLLYMVLKNTNLTTEFHTSLTTLPTSIDDIYGLLEEDINATIGLSATEYRAFLQQVKDINSSVAVADYETHVKTIKETLSFDYTPTHNGTTYGSVLSPFTTKIWLDRNLGASQVATTKTDSQSYGDYYQWGRDHDGHQEYTANTIDTQLTDLNTSGNSNFINDFSDWTTADANGSIRAAKWSKTDGTSICPLGYRVPTLAELRAETVNASTAVTSTDTAFSNFLKLPSAGLHLYSDYKEQGNNLNLWSVDVDSAKSFKLLVSALAQPRNADRADAFSIRCIKD
jgi:uncharacterized protein (TIGR02145 family)